MARIQTMHKRTGDLMTARMYNEIIDSVNALYDRQESFKGAYASPDDLGRVKGSDGDLALVLDDGAFPAAIYRHNGTAWAATGKTWSPTESIDLAAYAKSIDLAFLVCGTAAATAAKVVTAAGYALKNGGNIRIKMTNANTADDATLNINATGDVPLYYDGARASAANSWEAGETILVYYDVTTECFMACNAQGGGGKFANGQKVKDTGFDERPTKDSTNLVDSGTVFNETSRIAKKVEGGTDYLTIDMSNSTQTQYYRWLTHGSIKRTASGSYRQWVIKNDGYTHVHAYLGLNSALPNGDGFAFLIFQVPADFEPDPNADYIFSKHGATYVEDGVEYTISNYNSGNYLYYEEDVARARKNSITIERDVPEGTTYIIISTRSSAVTDVITLTKAVPVVGLEEKLTDMDGRVEAVEEAAEVIDEAKIDLWGGEKEQTTDGKTVGATSQYYMAIVGDAFKAKGHGSWTRWVITNNDYETIQVKTYYNGSLASGVSAVVLLCFAVGGDFVFDETKGYVQLGSYVYYPSNAYTSAQGSSYFWLTVDGSTEIEIPSGTAKIYVCARTTNQAGPEIILNKVASVRGLRGDVDELLAMTGGDEEGGMVRSRVVNNDQDCLWLRNYIQTNHSYYFEAQGGNDTYDTQGYLDWKISHIPDGKHFIFITDGHWQDNPTRSTWTSIYIASYMSKRLGGCPVFFGGDCINSASSKYLAAKAFSAYADVFFSAFGENGFWVQGIHDSNKLGLDTDNGIGVDEAIIEDTEIYKRSVARQAHKVTFDEIGIAAIQNVGLTDVQLANATAWMKLHYHWDDDVQKVRYIVYETGCTGWTWYKLCNTRTYSLPLLYPWVSRTMLSTPDDYDIVILGHMFGGKTASYTDYASGNTDSRNIMRLFRAFKLKSSIKVNMRSYHTSGGTAFSRAICGTSENRTFDFTSSKHKGHIFIVSGHWHNDLSFMCRYYTNIDGEDGKNGINVQRYNAADVTDDTVLHINVACDTAASGRNSYYTSRPSAAGQISECLFDVFTITEDDKLEATRIGYGNDRTFLLSGAQQEYDDDDSDDGGEGGEQEEPGEIINS